MNRCQRQDLERFYQGRVDEDERTLIEEFLFTSQVGLMEFFSIKRDAECHVTFMKTPTRQTKERLLNQMKGNPSVISFKAPPFKSKKSWMATACALMLIGGVYFWQTETLETPEASSDGLTLTVDTAMDLSSGSGFL